MTVESSGWSGVRCVLEHQAEGGHSHEEWITLWRAASSGEAIAPAEEEAADHAETLTGVRYLGLAQAYVLVDEPGQGAEVFSLVRDSEPAPQGCVDAFFDAGREHHPSEN